MVIDYDKNIPFAERLRQDFPIIFRKSAYSWNHCVDCGPGWFDIIYDLSAKIEKIAEGFGVPDEDNILVLQVKEKFGGLRFYLSHHNDEIDDLVREATQLSYITCEVCGAQGDTVSSESINGWISTLCGKCRESLIKGKQ